MTVLVAALDNNLSPRLAAVLNIIFRDQCRVLHHQEYAASNSPDHVWPRSLADKGGRLFLSGDVKISERPNEMAAIVKSGLVGFFLPPKSAGLRQSVKAALLIYVFPKVVEKFQEVSTDPSGSCWLLDLEVAKDVPRLETLKLKRKRIPDRLLDLAPH